MSSLLVPRPWLSKSFWWSDCLNNYTQWLTRGEYGTFLFIYLTFAGSWNFGYTKLNGELVSHGPHVHIVRVTKSRPMQWQSINADEGNETVSKALKVHGLLSVVHLLFFFSNKFNFWNKCNSFVWFDKILTYGNKTKIIRLIVVWIFFTK